MTRHVSFLYFWRGTAFPLRTGGGGGGTPPPRNRKIVMAPVLSAVAGLQSPEGRGGWGGGGVRKESQFIPGREQERLWNIVALWDDIILYFHVLFIMKSLQQPHGYSTSWRRRRLHPGPGFSQQHSAVAVVLPALISRPYRRTCVGSAVSRLRRVLRSCRGSAPSGPAITALCLTAIRAGWSSAGRSMGTLWTLWWAYSTFLYGNSVLSCPWFPVPILSPVLRIHEILDPRVHTSD